MSDYSEGKRLYDAAEEAERAAAAIPMTTPELVPMDPRDSFRFDLFREIIAERSRQLAKWGEQRRPLGNSSAFKQIADIVRDNCDESEAAGGSNWREIALEEFWEAFSESERDEFRVEAIQTMAVLFSALEDHFRDQWEAQCEVQ